MATQQPVPVGWAPMGNGGYKNPASGTVIYPDGSGGWQANPASGVGGQGALERIHQMTTPGDYPTAPSLRDAGSGQHIQSAAERSQIWNVSPRQRQLMLRSMGFNVKVDGKSGPQTAAAAWSFVHGHNAQWYNQQGRDWQQSIWNQHFAKYHQPAPHDPSVIAEPSSSTAPVDKNNHGAAGRSDAQFSGSGLDPNLAGAIGTGISALYRAAGSGTLVDPKQGALVGTMLDPTAEGAAAAEAQYGQSLRDNARTIKNLPGEAAQHIADLKSWYSQIGKTQTAGAKDTATMADNLISDAGGASAGVINALGGNANASAADLASAGEQEAGTLRALKLAGAIGAQDLGTAIGAEGLSARTRQRILDANALTDAQNKQTDLQKQSGAAEQQARTAAIAQNNSLAQTRYGNRMSAIGANNSLINDRAQRTAAALSAAESAALLPANIDYKNATAASALARAQAAAQPNGGKLPKGAFDNTDAKTKGAVADAAVTAAATIIKNKGTVEDAVKAVNNLYRSRGWSLRNPRVVKAIMASLRGAGVQVDPSWWAKFGYTGG